jgi:N-acyl-D-aspartate/D-glutamate deacylase
MGLLYGRAGRLTAKNGGFRPGQWIMDAHAPDYEPAPKASIGALAAARGVRPQQLLLEAMLADGGRGVVWYPYAHGYSERNYDNVCVGLECGMRSGLCVVGNADAGAHVAAFTDASCTTFMLSHWARDRTRGPTLPLEQMVKANSRDPARLYGWADRGTLEVGMKADVNVIDMAALRIHRPEVLSDLPSGASRWVQRASGYRLTIVAGVVTYRDGRATGALPGRLLRNPSTAAKRAAGPTFEADLARIWALREAGRGRFDVRAGIDRTGFVAHMPGPISQAFYRHERQQAAHERQQPGGKL